jgi:hypothetical protein
MDKWTLNIYKKYINKGNKDNIMVVKSISQDIMQRITIENNLMTKIKKFEIIDILAK